MALHRVLALVRKDLAWLRGHKAFIGNLFGGVIIGGMLFALSLFAKIAGGTAPLRPSLAFFILGFMTVFSGASLLVFREKTHGAMAALLTTPLRPLEFLTAKLFLISCFAGFFSFAFVLTDAVFFKNFPGFLVWINIILFILLMGFAGAALAVFCNDLTDWQRLMSVAGFLIMTPDIVIQFGAEHWPYIKKFAFFTPFSHFHEVMHDPAWRQALFHTAFHAILFAVAALFAVESLRLYFSSGNEKRFSRKLAVPLFVFVGLCVLSGFVSPPAVRSLRLENRALLSLRAAALQAEQKASAGAAASIKRIPLEDFFRNSAFAMPKLSPDGKSVAYLKPFQGKMNIYVRKTNDPSSERRLTSQTKRDIAAFAWKGNGALVFTRDFEGDENFHLFRVFADGTGEKDLTPFKGVKAQIIDFLEMSEENLLIAANKRSRRTFDVFRLNIKTGGMDLVAENPGLFTGWMTDHDGKLRVALSADGFRSSIHYRETEAGEFQKIRTTGLADSFTPLMFTFDNQNLYVSSNIGRDKAAVEIFDPRENKTVSILFSRPEASVSALTYSKKRKKLLSAVWIDWRAQRHFFDAEQERIFQDLRSKIPGKDIRIVSKNKEEDLMIAVAAGDRDPGSYYLYDVKNRSLSALPRPRPWIKEADMAEQKPVQYTSRDGLVIHGYLTFPQGKSPKNLPVVVKVHGGPAARDVWGYDPETQFLASRGYAVFQINFRGSTGYGKEFWIKGFKQWGRKMQDDITDGVHWLIERGVADKNRTAIYGGSYGGYAVLAGLAFTPDLYACGADYVGISNIFTFLKSIPPYWEPYREYLYETVGHPEKDRELLKSVSPFFHADKIKAPLFVAQGANDPRVKKAESDQIVEALEKRGIDIPYLVKSDEGHGFANAKNRLEFYSLLEAFLQKCLK